MSGDYEETKRQLAREERQEWIINVTLFAFAVAIGLGVLYGLVRFVKWAWTN